MAQVIHAFTRLTRQLIREHGFDQSIFRPAVARDPRLLPLGSASLEPAVMAHFVWDSTTQAAVGKAIHGHAKMRRRRQWDQINARHI